MRRDVPSDDELASLRCPILVLNVSGACSMKSTQLILAGNARGGQRRARSVTSRVDNQLRQAPSPSSGCRAPHRGSQVAHSRQPESVRPLLYPQSQI